MTHLEFNCSDEKAVALIRASRLYDEGAMPGWISVKDRLPEKQLRVIVCNGHGLVTAGWRSYNKDKKGNELWVIGDEPHHCNDITHWMPLPEAPKEE